MRFQFYKLELRFTNGKKTVVTMACSGIEHLEEVYNKNKMFYQNPGANILVEGFSVIDNKPTITMSEDEYQQELQFCDMIENLDEIRDDVR